MDQDFSRDIEAEDVAESGTGQTAGEYTRPLILSTAMPTAIEFVLPQDRRAKAIHEARKKNGKGPLSANHQQQVLADIAQAVATEHQKSVEELTDADYALPQIQWYPEQTVFSSGLNQMLVSRVGMGENDALWDSLGRTDTASITIVAKIPCNAEGVLDERGFVEAAKAGELTLLCYAPRQTVKAQLADKLNRFARAKGVTAYGSTWLLKQGDSKWGLPNARYAGPSIIQKHPDLYNLVIAEAREKGKHAHAGKVMTTAELQKKLNGGSSSTYSDDGDW